MKTNILILEKGCQNCAYIKVSCDMEKAEDDTFIGKDENKIFTFFSSSSEGTKLLTERFGITGVAPILKTSEGKELKKIDEIILFLKASGYFKA